MILLSLITLGRIVGHGGILLFTAPLNSYVTLEISIFSNWASGVHEVIQMCSGDQVLIGEIVNSLFSDPFLIIIDAIFNYAIIIIKFIFDVRVLKSLSPTKRAASV